jgi:exopolysaccharide biosynthesis polyprenyl glycosylphosphotransferase
VASFTEKRVKDAAPAGAAGGIPLQFLGPGDGSGSAWADLGLRALVLGAAIMAFLLVESAPTFRVAAFGVLICAIFLAAQQLGLASLPSASGRVTAAALGAALGFLLSAAAIWLVPFEVHKTTLLACGATAFALAVPREPRPRARRILVVGSGSGSLELIKDVAKQGDGRFEIVAVVGDSNGADHEDWGNATFYRSIYGLPDAVALHRPDLVVVNLETGRLRAFRMLLDLAGMGFRIVGLPEFYEHAFGRVPVTHLTPAWFMSLLHLYQRSYAGTRKRVFDIVGASIALLVTLPLALLIAVLVGRPVLYRQVRLGEWGRPFTMYKFRTMGETAEERGGAVFTDADDPRITSAGRLLRRMRLDELPQLWNVLAGDMSLVGPRPERPEFYATLEAEVPNWTRRHMVKPGITGWAQINSGYAYDLDTTSDKLSYDLWYLRHRSFLVDLMICVRTIPKLVSGFGAR